MSEPDYRFTLANERTFLAWVRTALGLLAAALFVFHVIDELGGTTLIGLLLCAGAGIAIVGGYRRYRATDRAIRAGEPLPTGQSTRLLAAAVLVAVLAVTVAALPDVGNALDTLLG